MRPSSCSRRSWGTCAALPSRDRRAQRAERRHAAVTTDPAAVGTTTVIIDRVIEHPGDESLNGLWSLVVEDTKSGGAGKIDTWSLRFSSRMD